MDWNTGIELVAALAMAIATIALAYLTSRYVRLTNQMLKETKASKDPAVFADLELPPSGVVLVIGNAGISTAHNVEFELKDNVPWQSTKDRPFGFGSIPVLKDGISYLAPGRKLKFKVGLVDLKRLKTEGGNVEIRISFMNSQGERFSQDLNIDMKQYSNVLFESFRDEGTNVASAIHDLERSIQPDPLGDGLKHYMGTIPCPICGERISPKAIKCPKCLEFIQDKNKDT